MRNNIKITLEEYIDNVSNLNYDCVTINEMYDLVNQHHALCEEHCDDENLSVYLANNESIELINTYWGLFRKPMISNSDIDKIKHRSTIHEGTILCEDDNYSRVMVSLFVNGNNGITRVSTESLTPILRYIEFIESDGGKAFISGVSYHSDVYYYAVTTIFWK